MASTEPRKFSDQIYSWSPSDGAFWWPSDDLYGRFTTQAPGGNGGGGGGGGGKPKLAISATDAVKSEGSDGGTTTYTFTITRSGNTSEGTLVYWSVTGSGGDPADAEDFGGSLPGDWVFFPVGETTKVITVEVQADGSIEADEGFTVTLSDATAGTQITTASAGGTILNDDLGTALSIAATGANKVEGSGGGTTAYTFTVTRSGDTSSTSSVEWDAAGSGADGGDFSGALSGTVNFAVDETEQVITVYVNADGDVEQNEGFTVTLSNPVDATIDVASADGTIVNDDGILTEYTTAVVGSDYNITIIFVGTGWTTDMQGVVIDAANVVSGIIVGDVSDVVFPWGIGGGDPAYTMLWNQPIDDIVIEVKISDIVDDPNDPISNVVAETRILAYRDDTDVGGSLNELNMPVASEITLDIDDVAGSVAGDWTEILLHEMIHAVGFSYSIFTLDGLVGTVGHGPFTTYQFEGFFASAAYGGRCR